MNQLKNRLRRDDSEIPRQIEALTTRVATIEGTLAQLLANQNAQTALLQQILKAPATFQTLDDNKKGEKEVGVIPTTQGEQVEHLPTSEGELQEDTIANRLANSIGVSTEIIPVHTTVLRVLTPEVVCPMVKERGEPSSKSEFRPIMVDPPSPVKPKGKNTQRVAKTVFHWALPDRSFDIVTSPYHFSSIRQVSNTLELLL
ncbi:hypothetical protein ACR2XN_28515 [Klebsiella pneumoniae]